MTLYRPSRVPEDQWREEKVVTVGCEGKGSCGHLQCHQWMGEIQQFLSFDV